MRLTSLFSERSVHRVQMATAFLLPLSFKIYFPGRDLEIIVPAEPMIALTAMMVFGSWFLDRPGPSIALDRMRHPVVVAMLLYLTALGLSLVFSSHPVVSAKAVLVQVSYAVAFFFPFMTSGHNGLERLGACFRAFAVGMACVVGFTFWRQLDLGFDRRGASHAAFPFFTDHAVYAAALAFAAFVPFAFPAQRGERNGLWYGIAAICCCGLLLSFSRAAWLSVVVALVLPGFALVRVRRRWVIAAMVGVSAAILLVGERAWEGLRANKADANADNAGLLTVLASTLNFKTDLSNTERLNRWACAWRMFRTRPWTGYGPGTFQFEYMQHQRPEEVTYISMNTHPDRSAITRAWTWSEELVVRAPVQVVYFSGGTAHSEYLLAFADLGWPGGAAVGLLLLVPVVTGMRLSRASRHGADRWRPFALTASAVAYAVHALFNNYMDDPRLSFSVLATAAALLLHDRPAINAHRDQSRQLAA